MFPFFRTAVLRDAAAFLSLLSFLLMTLSWDAVAAGL